MKRLSRTSPTLIKTFVSTFLNLSVDGYTSSVKPELERLMKLLCPNENCSNYNQASSQSIVRNGKDDRGRQRYLCKICDRTFTTKTQPNKKAHQRKKGQKGIKSMRGRPEMYSEVKAKVSFTLTPSAVKGLDNLSSSLNLSRSEFIERIGRSIIPVQPNVPNQ